MSSTTLSIDEVDIPNTLFEDQATLARVVKERPTEDNRMQGDKTDAEREETHAGDRRLEL